MPVLKPQLLLDERISAIRAVHLNTDIPIAELDLSGGIDSAVMACLLVTALGPENVILVHSGMDTNPEQTARAQNLADALKCPMINIDLSGIYDQFISLAGASIVEAHNTQALSDVKARCDRDKTILGSIRSTLRAPVGRAFNRLLGGGLRHGTGNECEDRFLRFYQKGGDGEVDSNPLAMLSKSEVYQLAFALGQKMGVAAQMRVIIEATPSPDLWGEGDGHSDEAELLVWTGAPFTYGRIDAETGKVTSYGTIERVSRFLDLPATLVMSQPGNFSTIGELLFAEHSSESTTNFIVSSMARAALDNPLFRGKPFSPEAPNVRVGGFTSDEIETFLMAARKVEGRTRHKENPNCPTYGNREELVAAGILTNDLPTLDSAPA